MFKQVESTMDFPAMERELLGYWYENGIVEKYLKRNEGKEEKFSFLDGPITANNPMGVHHGWGRTYKDVWQRFFNMSGLRQRFVNGFDEQGLWVEVEVEKELGLKSKKDIENLVPGDKFASLEKFINLCKARVKKFAAVQTDQSKRLGYFMDWENSYHTSSDRNNYEIWNYLKTVWEKGWLYKGRDSVPWCPRCGTAISQHEILTEDYAELTHESVYVKLPIRGRKDEYLVIWTTTPWTVPANVAVAVDPEKDYLKIKTEDGFIYLMKARTKAMGYQGEGERVKGKDLVGLEYDGPFDHLERVQKALEGYTHRVVENDPLILPISEEEGTGLVHIATGAGTEDFRLGKKLGLPVIELIEENADYLEGMGDLSGKNAKWDPNLVLDQLREKENGKFLLKTEKITHRYPRCWRCKTELVWRVVDEWYVGMDIEDGNPSTDAQDKATYREQMMEVAKKIHWMPKWGLERELDWLKNMHDWLISKKRYWGLALPIWECKECGNFDVISSREELKERAVEGWGEFEGNSPHRPWVDQVKIECSKCGKLTARIPDVGNPWLDAGIVPFSTMPPEWFPADFVTEGFPGQFKNWFYSLIAMSTALKRTNPFKNLLGFANVVDEKGEEMHKSKGNSVEFNEAADKAGVDVMRWLYVSQNPEFNLKFGYHVTDDIRRRFYLIFWNTYKFFVDYANLNNWACELERGELSVLDKWVLARLTEVVLGVNKSMEKFDAASASRMIEEFVVNDLSTWYIRRSRDRVSLNAPDRERSTVLGIIYGNLVTLSKLTAPFMPFITEEICRNLTGDESVHLADYPMGDKTLLNDKLVADMKVVRQVVEMGHASRKDSAIKLRQPLAGLAYFAKEKLNTDLEKIIEDELNVKKIEYQKSSKSQLKVELDTNITPKLKAEGEAREIIRSVQKLRKEQGLTLRNKVSELGLPEWPKDFEEAILAGTGSTSIVKSDEIKILKIETD